jgi:hypothetical protein
MRVKQGASHYLLLFFVVVVHTLTHPPYTLTSSQPCVSDDDVKSSQSKFISLIDRLLLLLQVVGIQQVGPRGF